MTEQEGTMPLRFRVWDTQLGKFVVPDNCDTRDWLWIEELSHFMVRLGISHFGYNGRCIISQDTGLKDKDSKPIFTGDIVQNEDGVGAVGYDAPVLELRYNYKYASQVITGKVVGNIWENPELLEEK